LSNKIQREKDFYDKKYDPVKEHKFTSLRSMFVSITGRSARFYYDNLAARCPNKRVLELGCGSKGNSVIFASKRDACSATGIDVSDVAIETARKQVRQENLKNIEFLVMNVEEMDFTDNSFELICGSGIPHHLNIEKAFSEIARTLEPDGIAIFSKPLGHNPFINLFRKITPGMRTKDEHPLLMKDFKVAKRFFRDVEIHYFHLLSLIAIGFWKFSFFDKLLDRLGYADEVLLRLFPFAKKYSWYVVVSLSGPIKMN
jgi:ubiquinone/menaquinone biosynthesis C-methylase UbiE